MLDFIGLVMDFQGGVVDLSGFSWILHGDLCWILLPIFMDFTYLGLGGGLGASNPDPVRTAISSLQGPWSLGPTFLPCAFWFFKIAMENLGNHPFLYA